MCSCLVASAALGCPRPAAAQDLFHAGELSADFLGFYSSHDKDGKGSAWGYGAGVNYFITANWGVGADTYADAFTVPYLLNVSAIFRYPLSDPHFAPYAFGGGGRQWEHEPQWSGHLGAGIEYRLNANNGVFADIREVFPDNTKDSTVLRFGIRFVFN